MDAEIVSCRIRFHVGHAIGGPWQTRPLSCHHRTRKTQNRGCHYHQSGRRRAGRPEGSMRPTHHLRRWRRRPQWRSDHPLAKGYFRAVPTFDDHLLKSTEPAKGCGFAAYLRLRRFILPSSSGEAGSTLAACGVNGGASSASLCIRLPFFSQR